MPGVRCSDVADEGCVEYVQVNSPALGPLAPSKLRFSPSKHKRKICRSRVKLLWKHETFSPPTGPRKRSLLEDLSFASVLPAHASRGKSRRSGWDRQAAPVFQIGFP